MVKKWFSRTGTIFIIAAMLIQLLPLSVFVEGAQVSDYIMLNLGDSYEITDIAAPVINAVAGPGSAVGATMVSSSDTPADHFAVTVTDSSVGAIYSGQNITETTNIVEPYNLGDDITVGVSEGKYLQLYNMDGYGIVTGFFEKQLAAEDINSGESGEDGEGGEDPEVGYTVSGTVTDGTDPIEGAAVVIFNEDEDEVTSASTDKGGDFTFSLPDGTYYIYVSAEGFKAKYAEITVNGGDLSVPAIELEKILSYTDPSGNTFTYKVNTDDSLTITDFVPGEDRDVIIPGTIDDKAVTKIDECAFFQKGITSVVIPEGITDIGVGAFTSVMSDTDPNVLTNVTIPASVRTIGDSAFFGQGFRYYTGSDWAYTRTLETVTFAPGSQLESIGESAFKENVIESITIPDNVASIGPDAFSSNRLTAVIIPSHISTISEGLFARNQLSNITIPANITAIDAYAFAGNQLTDATIENDSVVFGADVFVNNQDPASALTIHAADPSTAKTYAGDNGHSFAALEGEDDGDEEGEGEEAADYAITNGTGADEGKYVLKQGASTVGTYDDLTSAIGNGTEAGEDGVLTIKFGTAEESPLIVPAEKQEYPFHNSLSSATYTGFLDISEGATGSLSEGLYIGSGTDVIFDGLTITHKVETQCGESTVNPFGVVFLTGSLTMNGNSSIDDSAIYSAGVHLYNQGHLTVNSGTIRSAGQNSYAIRTVNTVIGMIGAVTINSGEISCTGENSVAISVEAESITVNGGNIESADNYAVHMVETAAGNSALFINGGSITSGAGSAIYLEGSGFDTFNTNSNDVVVAGGSIQSSGTDTIFIRKYTANDWGTGEVWWPNAAADIFGLKLHGSKDADIQISGTGDSEGHTITSGSKDDTTVTAANFGTDIVFEAWTSDEAGTSVISTDNGATVGSLSADGNTEAYLKTVSNSGGSEDPEDPEDPDGPDGVDTDAEGNTYNYLDNGDGTVSIKSFTRNGDTTVIIPDKLDGLTVKRISDISELNSVFYNKGLTSVTLPDTIAYIGRNAFGHNSLAAVTIPADVTEIGRYAFSGQGDPKTKQNALAEVSFAEGSKLETIGEGAFSENIISAATLPQSLRTIGDEAFAGNLLQELIVPSSVDSIGEGAFAGNRLTDVTIENAETTIGAEAFAYNQEVSTDLTIHGYKGSTAEAYATAPENGHTFAPLDAEAPTYTVTYSGNGNTGGSVPIDSGAYIQGETVTVLGNTGSLVKSGHTFAGWNTAADGKGTNYTAGAGFIIGNTNVTLYAKWTANTPPEPSNEGGSTTTQQNDGTDIIVNGNTHQNAATIVTARDTNGRTITTVAVDEQKLDQILSSLPDAGAAGMQGSGTPNPAKLPVVQLKVAVKSDVVIGQLSGRSIKMLESKSAVLEIKTENVTYTLPASQLNIDDVSNQIGNQAALKDIKVNIKISASTGVTAKIMENTAKKDNYQLVVKPIDFEITCSSGDKTVEVSKFNGYVERTVAIPEGVDPRKITTGIVLNADGAFSHVPTTILVINGRYHAKINSLTNSTYSVIYHPVEFKDAAAHWAKNAVNDMGSRLIIDDMGNGNFEPDREITRGEFAAAVLRALGLMRNGTGKASFKDVAKTDRYYDTVSIAKDNGIIDGYENGTFKPDERITREQAMAIIARAMEITGLKVELDAEETQKLLATFKDSGKSPNCLKTYIAKCIKAGIVSGRNNNMLAPKDKITRAEAATILRNLLQVSKLIN